MKPTEPNYGKTNSHFQNTFSIHTPNTDTNDVHSRVCMTISGWVMCDAYCDASHNIVMFGLQELLGSSHRWNHKGRLVSVTSGHYLDLIDGGWRACPLLLQEGVQSIFYYVNAELCNSISGRCICGYL